ncbi:DUF3307 domain-containing protein [Echinicola vietnamensis]|uniref:DUF3307 domain-containing protein n=1 Tax=Echinicola vietnamensis (strain DSM 17526 / LMG 23754 / KMM 6221) TaxID=926556 RepID=L0G1A5_ECHVK|nr:DUF3307 domain-containing protein [Echinicola vietnamensis]AGA79332.1 Protein of unknown function (DUF3307) [Echinicola vietnamensis DSM 17526]
MNLVQLFILQLLAHMLADFYFQNDRLAAQKNTHGFRSPFLKWHILIVFLLSWGLSFQAYFIYGALVIALTHYIIDGLKVYLNRSKWLGKYAFFIDQALHLLVIVVVTMGYGLYLGINPWWEMKLSAHSLMIIFAYMVCLKPSNIFIKETLKAYEIKVPGTNDLPNAGKLIGVLERILVLTFILLGEFQAVGFLIAAKSILRFKNDDILKAEYVLIGTLISFGIAILLGTFVELL